MGSQEITYRDRTTNSGSTRAGSVPVVRRLTELLVDGKVVDTIIWNQPLERRNAQKGITREEYIASCIARLKRNLESRDA